MIDTFFSSGSLGSPAAFVMSLIIGIAFGAVLENAGFGSSRRLAGIFYFRDMAVLKVMFTGVVVCMIAMGYAKGLGWVNQENVYFLPTFYGAQVLGGLIFGVGFVMSGWCPGTAAVGLASGKLDALVFLCGASLGSMIYNEVYPVIKNIAGAGGEVLFAYDSLGMSEAGLAFLITLVAIGCFWGAEKIERETNGEKGGDFLGSKFLKLFSVILIAGTFGLFAVGGSKTPASGNYGGSVQEQTLLGGIQAASDHMEPQELADRLMAGDASIQLIDIRTPGEYSRFHIRSAVNIQVENLSKDELLPYKNKGIIVLYSNGMTHPAQARDSLFRMGFENAYFLTDGLEGFLNNCLKPASLRSEPVSGIMQSKINAWRNYFLNSEDSGDGIQPLSIKRGPDMSGISIPGIVETGWLEENLNKGSLKIIDLRAQPEYNSGHIPQSLSLNTESLRGISKGVPSSLLPKDMLARHFSLMEIDPEDLLVVVCTEKLQDEALFGMACERLGHQKYVFLNGGFPKWVLEKRQVDTLLPNIGFSEYPVDKDEDRFTVAASNVMAAIGDGRTVIIDVRPSDYYTGVKQDEARGGHIPGAINRPFSEDVIKLEGYTAFKPAEILGAEYEKIIKEKQTPVIVHCRTGHQASQTYFVLVRMLGYDNVKWYDAGWTEWAARPEFPVEK